jgi:carbonic anhydrase
MEKVVAFESQKEHYTADACVVWCFDDRFYKLLKAFGKQEGFKNIDLVKVAGGAKALAGGATPTGEPSPERDFLLNQIKTSIRLHNTKRVVLMTHRDCGAYGGSKSFADASAEVAEHEAQLKAAKDFVVIEIGGAAVGIPVDAYFADFDGLYKI